MARKANGGTKEKTSTNAGGSRNLFSRLGRISRKGHMKVVSRKLEMNASNLSIVMITARKECHLDWVADSLRRQLAKGEKPQLITIDFWSQVMPLDEWSAGDVAARRDQLAREAGEGFDVVISPPKPCVWQGPHRVTKENWFANSNARNTGFCLAQRPFVAFCDDRCVLSDHWLYSVRLAMERNYVVAGAYEKRWYMNVQNGVVTVPGTVVGRDNRSGGSQAIVACNGNWLYGGTFALPLEWALAVNGFEELMDGLSFEDVIFGLMLQNRGYLLKYDERMLILQDRTPAQCLPVMKRTDKGVSPRDKSHAALVKFGRQVYAQHPWNLRQIRNNVLGGGAWPAPVGTFPLADWFDGQQIT